MGKPDEELTGIGYLYPSADKDDPAARIVGPRTSITRVNCPELFARVKTWLDECHSSHGECDKGQLGPEKAAALPTFLLNIGLDEDQVYLERVRSSSDIDYAALSYCWGKMQSQATTVANLESHMAGIPSRNLPRTICDAVTVARTLGISFLWVDSLCIIQDSHAARQEELRRMGPIYHNAHLVISAASARTCEDGFLQDRPRPSEYIRMPFGDDGCVYFVPRLSKYSSEGLGHDPIDERAWTFQESYLARRLLVFGSHEVSWACMTDGGDDHGRNSGFWAVIHRGDSCRSLQKISIPEPRDWGFVIVPFCRRAMSYEADKLPALSSVAELFSHHLKCDYLAGIFIDSAPQLLTWYTLTTERGEAKRRDKWRAPSWSFLSVDGPIGLADLNGSTKNGPPFTSEFWNCGWGIIDYQITPLSLDVPFGQITDAQMRVGGRMIPVAVGAAIDDITRPVYQLEVRGDLSENQWRPRYEPGGLRIILDSMASQSEPSQQPFIATCYGFLPLTVEMWWFLMWHGEESTNGKQPWESGFAYRDVVWGLALARLEEGRYHRVGYILCESERDDELVPKLNNMPCENFTFV
ncbi:heterokaryon incompatibility protein-domain-containing protein [Ilyonectria destructans]|nr:heterokaryon incompatibility protein-domain-containing protein [Ilyonectria destructans]